MRSNRAVELLPLGRSAPAIMAGSGLYWGHGEHALPEALRRRLQIPVLP